MHFTNLTNVQDRFCIAGGADCLGNLLHSPPKNAETSANPYTHMFMCTHAEGFLTRSKQLSYNFLCSSYWFLSDSPQFHHCIPVQEQLIIILSWALKPETIVEITYVTFTFFIHAYMLLMPQFIPSVTALPQIYWQWGTIISLLPSVPATPDRDGKKSGKEFYQIHSEGSSKPAHPVSWSSYSHMCSMQRKETI